MKKKILPIVALGLLAITIYGTCIYKHDPKEDGFETGEYYLLYRWENVRDPFETPRIDTIKILEKKNGYVKWTFKYWEYYNDNIMPTWISSPERDLLLMTKKIEGQPSE